MSQQVGIAYELFAIAAAVLGGVSLRGGEGTVLGIIVGSGVMRVIENGIIMFQVVINGRRYDLGTNWTYVIIGAVILVAVVLDQVFHIVQDRRRVRRAGAAGAAGAGPAPAAPVPLAQPPPGP